MPITSYSHSRNRPKSEAGNPLVFLIAIVLAVLAACAVFLSTRDIPAPHHVIEKVISNDQFFK